MLNWRREEEEYIDKSVKNYINNLSGWSMIFMSEKDYKRNIEYVKRQARDSYRERKLDDYLNEVKEERKRIDALINEINVKFNEFLDNQQHIIDNEIKPFELKVVESSSPFAPVESELEVVRIECKPFKLAFIQEKID